MWCRDGNGTIGVGRSSSGKPVSIITPLVQAGAQCGTRGRPGRCGVTRPLTRWGPPRGRRHQPRTATAQVGTEHLRLLRLAELEDAYRLAPPPGPQGHVAHPRGDAARCDEIALATVGEQVDRRRSPLPARSQGAALPWAKPTWRGPPTHREDARAIDAQPQPGEQGDDSIKDGGRDLARPHVAIRHPYNLLPGMGDSGLYTLG
jgi:hypothetical protein